MIKVSALLLLVAVTSALTAGYVVRVRSGNTPNKIIVVESCGGVEGYGVSKQISGGNFTLKFSVNRTNGETPLFNFRSITNDCSKYFLIEVGYGNESDLVITSKTLNVISTDIGKAEVFEFGNGIYLLHVNGSGVCASTLDNYTPLMTATNSTFIIRNDVLKEIEEGRVGDFEFVDISASNGTITVEDIVGNASRVKTVPYVKGHFGKLAVIVPREGLSLAFSEPYVIIHVGTPMITGITAGNGKLEIRASENEKEFFRTLLGTGVAMKGYYVVFN